MSLRDQLQKTLGSAYAIERELGGGGMSTVFVAHDTALDRKVVVKVLPEHLSGGASIERFQREIMVAAGLQHPHIVGVLSAGQVGDLPYFIMPFVEGESLRTRLEGGEPLPVREVVNILRDVALALGYAHQRGIVHRDIKPDNVLVSGGAAALTDFGVAKALRSARGEGDPDGPALTEAGTSLGTPAYMAPEQAAGETDLDHRADIYSLGITAYEMLSGKPPFHGRPFSQLIAAHITESPPPLEVPDAPPGLSTLIMQCLAKAPDDRPASASALVDALDESAFASGADWAASRSPARRLRVAGASAIVVALAATLGVWLSGRGAAPAGADVQSIAVLPLINVGGDTADAYFADGMTDELITALQSVPGLRVASRTSVFAFKGDRTTPQEIGDALNVSTLLEGTVRRGGDRLRLTAQLVNVADGFAMWSQTYESEMRDIFAVQDSIATAIVTALRRQFGGGEASPVAARRGTADLEAYDLYLRGRYFFSQRGAASLRRAITFFQEAVSRDSGFAAAFAGLADSYGLLPLYSTTPADSVFPLALAAADRAIALDSTLAGAFAARGNLFVTRWRWSDAEVDFRRAITLDPEYATAHQWLGELLIIMGRVAEGVQSLGRATTLDPLSPVMAASHATALAHAGDAPAAVERGRRAVDLASSAVTHMMLGNALLHADRPEEAIVEIVRAARLAGPIAAPKGLLGLAYARAGRIPDARAVRDTLAAAPDAPGHAAAIARIDLGLNRPDSAMAWLERAFELRDPFFSSEGLAGPVFAPLRARPRFHALIEGLRLRPDLLAR